ncbi:LOW QUALITY PROTEIN: apolipoprotein L2-like [Tachyglossus aculeatus]|uniref:LOW QUALITY PROTEIN: apolipoprotein L2-like n=1 Tax=Tachyglossus aculeatus TaxID=9261 RepID=UPI0018F4AAAF|nr:LOW QUALITY PROTEIN: apolipoprotein L2-like [Tachyglossus aculeatus]
MAQGPPTLNMENINELCHILEHLEACMSREELQCLLATDQSRELLVTKYSLDRNEVNVFFDAIFDVKGEISDTLEELDRRQKELNDCITELNDAADNIDQIHKNCTIAQLVAKSTSSTSGILITLGFALVPVTAGGSLILSAVGTGLGTAAAVTSIAADVVDGKSSAAAKERAISGTNLNGKLLQNEVVQTLKENKVQISSAVHKGRSFIQCVKAIGEAQKRPRLVAYARRFSAMGNIAQNASRRGRNVQKAFGGTALAMAKGARVVGGLTASVGILIDAVAIVRDSQHLHQGAKSETATELRKRASDLREHINEIDNREILLANQKFQRGYKPLPVAEKYSVQSMLIWLCRVTCLCYLVLTTQLP